MPEVSLASPWWVATQCKKYNLDATKFYLHPENWEQGEFADLQDWLEVDPVEDEDPETPRAAEGSSKEGQTGPAVDATYQQMQDML